MNKTYKYRLQPSKSQIRVLERTLEVCRMTYNDLLSKRIEYYKETGKTLTCYDQSKYITTQKEIHQGLKTVYTHVLQNVSTRVDLAFQGFFRRLKYNSGKAGFPRFKPFKQYNSFTYPSTNGSSLGSIKNGKIFLSKHIGYIKLIKHREVEGTIKTITVEKNSTGKWFVCIVCNDVLMNTLPKTNKEVGIDLGLSEFATLSNGITISNPRFFKTSQVRLAKAQCKLSKLKEVNNKSQEYKRQKKIVARIHERIKNQRDNFIHQESRKVINSYDLIVVEDLNINKMKEDGKYPSIAKGIADVAWRDFLNKLDYKAENAGRKVIKINPAYTSQTCSQCHCRKKLVLSDRTFKCDNCKQVINRDLNASINILRLGLESLGNQSIKA